MSGEEGLESFFLNTKPVKILIELGGSESSNYASALSREVGVTYSHTVKVLQRMEDYSLVEFEKKGRKKEVYLTEKGENLAERLGELLEEF